jgi:hypothetical protein
MKKLLMAATLGLLAVTSAALAGDQIVRWDRLDGTLSVDPANSSVGPILAARARTVGGGSVIVNLNTGFVSFRVDGMSVGGQYFNGPLGSPGLQTLWMGTIVCDSTQRYGPMTWGNTPAVEFSEGNGAFQGFVTLPDGCAQRPDEMAFLVRHASAGPQYGLWTAYGADRHIQ